MDVSSQAAAGAKEAPVALLRLATARDGRGMAEVYAPYVRDTATSFEVEPPSPMDMRARVRRTRATLPWLVCEADGKVAGFGYAAPYRSRPAYAWSVEVSAYVGLDWRGHGVGTALYTALVGILRLQGFVNAYAAITLPNAPSVALHRASGFREVGVFEAVGHKHGLWRDVSWWALRLQRPPEQPVPPFRMADIVDGHDFAAALTAGLDRLHLPAPPRNGGSA